MKIDCDDPRARFGVDVYRDGSDTTVGSTCYTTREEARGEIERLGRIGNFSSIEIYEASSPDEWGEAVETFEPSDSEECS